MIENNFLNLCFSYFPFSNFLIFTIAINMYLFVDIHNCVEWRKGPMGVQQLKKKIILIKINNAQFIQYNIFCKIVQ